MSISFSIFAQEEVVAEKADTTEDKVFRIVEIMPLFSSECINLNSVVKQNDCSYDALSNYIKGIQYSKDSIQKNETKKAYVQFIIDKEANVTEVILIKKTGSVYFDNLAFNHIKNMPKWAKAPMEKGEKVKLKLLIPISFAK